ncbi:hypothetical protein JMJ35_009998 [Cladonia borealis]|uniref:Uncharacterized protein n=1 Tax=Cladonia borealis TaxID=184061 RepID=A0AA39QQW3_9LECA|nr:hypothetical protein JMJ35_009998 [Cladonia borealis]
MKSSYGSKVATTKTPDHIDQAIREYLSNLRNSYDGDNTATAEGVLHEVQSLERRQYAQSRFRRIAAYLQPLLGFFMMYSPALDMMVQFDPNPSTIVWGSLKSSAPGPLERDPILQVRRMRINKTRRHPLYLCQVALKDLYLEVLLFLQKIQTTVSHICPASRLLIESFFRSTDVQFQDNIQRLSRGTERE